MKNIRWVVMILLVTVVLSACQTKETPAAVESAAPAPSLVAQGYLAPIRSADLAFTSGGKISEVLVAEGDMVKAGQPLARQEPSAVEARQADLARANQEIQAARLALAALIDGGPAALAQAKFAVVDLEKQIKDAKTAVENAKEPETGDVDPLLVAQAEARQALLEQQLKDAERLLEKLGSSGIDPDKQASADARLAAAEASLASAEAAARQVELVAPWDGVVGSISITAGQFVSPGQPVLGLADFSSWVVLTDNLTEIEVVGLQAGDPVKIMLDALPGQEINGSIKAIRPRFELKRGDITYTVTISIDTLPADAMWGMTAAVSFSR